MLSNYFRIAFRNLWRKKAFSTINITGLAVGVAASLLIFLVIHYETSYDTYQSRRDRIYRVVTTHVKHANGEIIDQDHATPMSLSVALRNDLPQLEKVGALWNIDGAQVHVPGPRGLEDEHIYKENRGLFFVEPGVFKTFDYQWLEGNASRLNEPNTGVLSKSLADKFFGSPRNAMGKTVQLWSFRVPLLVTGVFKDLPENTDVQVTLGGSYATFRKINQDAFTDPNTWGKANWSSECYVLAAKGQDMGTLAAQLPRFVNKYYPVEQAKGTIQTRLSFQPLREIHLDSHFGTWKGDALHPKELWALGMIGAFLLLVACINFINLATAQSVTRSKEIGVRKVLGGGRLGLLREFLQETALISFAALVLGVILAWMAVPFLGDLMRKPLALDLWHTPALLLFLGIIWIVVTLLSGFYPGLVLSRFNPIEAIRNKINAKAVGGISLRRALVVVQFVIAQLLVIGTIVVIRQMQFFRSQPLGYEKKALALLELPSDSLDRLRYDYLKNELLRVPGVSAASFCMDAPASLGSLYGNFWYDNDPVKKGFGIAKQYGDTSYLNTFRIGLVAGRIPYGDDSIREMLVNESLVRQLGLTSTGDVLGKKISFDKDGPGYTIVGVMHDFHNKSLREAIMPLALLSNTGAYNFIAFRMDAGRMSATLDKVQTLFTHTYPYYIYDLNFFDQKIEAFYRSEVITSQLFKVFAFLAIFISCLGLYGLVSFMAVQKTKEVGIRKVLGASIQSIVYMFSREFTLLIGMAFLLSAPLGYYIMHQWLSGFFYHVQMGWGVFVLAIVFSIGIAWITVGYKAVRAAVANPIKSLRTE